MTQSADTEIDRIISAGRISFRHHGPLQPVVWLSLLSMSLLWLCFTPLEFAAAAWISLTPACVLLRTPVLSRRQYAVITVCGWIWALCTLQWMRLGDPTMYPALLAMAFYVGLYIPAFIGVSHRLIRHRFPLWLTVPIVWTSLEFLRARLMTGFGWYFLGHSQYRWIELIQIADITGVYGISFLTAMSSAVLAEFIPESSFAKPGFETPKLMSAGQRLSAAATCALLVGMCVVYGWQRKQSLDVTHGPVVALVQGYFPPDVKHDPNRAQELINTHDLLSRRAGELQPDLIVWPETMWPVPDWNEDPRLTDEQVKQFLETMLHVPPERSAEALLFYRRLSVRESLVNRSQEIGTPMLFGIQTLDVSASGIKNYNSAAFVRPDLGYMGRYDKMHCVIFGEYTPLKSIVPFLADLRPPGMPELDAGMAPQIFESGGVRYAPVICFEDTVPRVVRRIVNHHEDSAVRPDVLVNMTNDGWFRGSSELDQHLITSSFRCVETRRPMVRAVNGGISAFIDSSGRIRDPEHFLIMTSSKGIDGEFKQVDSMIDEDTGRWFRECSGVLTGQLPLDGRHSIYLQYGDWFAMLCSGLVLALCIRSFVKPRNPNREMNP